MYKNNNLSFLFCKSVCHTVKFIQRDFMKKSATHIFDQVSIVSYSSDAFGNSIFLFIYVSSLEKIKTKYINYLSPFSSALYMWNVWYLKWFKSGLFNTWNDWRPLMPRVYEGCRDWNVHFISLIESMVNYQSHFAMLLVFRQSSDSKAQPFTFLHIKKGIVFITTSVGSFGSD